MVDMYLEPEADELLKAGFNTANTIHQNPALYSIAISLKRIADILTAPPIIMNAAELNDEEFAEEMAKQRYMVNKP